MSKPIGVVLAGGAGRRMGGLDKALTPLAGQPMLGHVLARLQPQVSQLVINANGDPARFAPFGVDVVGDSLPDYAGPLAGVLAGMNWGAQQGATHIVTVATDTPFLPEDLVARLSAPGRVDVPIVAQTSDGAQPVFGLWPVALRSQLLQDLERGTRKVMQWLMDHDVQRVSFEDQSAFFNVNTAEDLERAEAMLGF